MAVPNTFSKLKAKKRTLRAQGHVIVSQLYSHDTDWHDSEFNRHTFKLGAIADYTHAVTNC